MSGLEAMSCGRPLLVGLDEDTVQQCYPEFPPVLVCHTEQQIYDQLKAVLDSDLRRKVGEDSRNWILKYHDWEPVTQGLIQLYESVLGRGIVQAEYWNEAYGAEYRDERYRLGGSSGAGSVGECRE
jgi:glycosyltransferase involved in cell wall biosynthesis